MYINIFTKIHKNLHSCTRAKLAAHGITGEKNDRCCNFIQQNLDFYNPSANCFESLIH